jgi:hypothetical protein
MDRGMNAHIQEEIMYQISNRISGQDLGVYDADSELAALTAMARDAGYTSLAEMDEVTGGHGDLIVAEVTIGYVACDYTDGYMLEDVRHGDIRATEDLAREDAKRLGLWGVRWVAEDGYLYVDRPAVTIGRDGDVLDDIEIQITDGPHASYYREDETDRALDVGLQVQGIDGHVTVVYDHVNNRMVPCGTDRSQWISSELLDWIESLSEADAALVVERIKMEVGGLVEDDLRAGLRIGKWID